MRRKHPYGHDTSCPRALGGSPITSQFSRLKHIFGDRLYIQIHHLPPGDGRTVREAERALAANLAFRSWQPTTFSSSGEKNISIIAR